MKITNLLQQTFQLKAAQKIALKRLNIETVHDMLYHLPTRYESFQHETQDLQLKAKVSIKGQIKKINMRRVFRKNTMMTEAEILTLDNKVIKAMWFNQPYIAKKFPVGSDVIINGQVTGKEDKKYIANPDIKPISNLTIVTPKDTEELIPIYPESVGISSLWFRTKIDKILNEIEEIKDPIPQKILDKYSLPTLKDAFLFIHKPKRTNDIETAKKRFAFDEVFLMQIMKQKERHLFLQKNTLKIKPKKEELQTIKNRFSFELTECQKKVVTETLKDLEGKNGPMQRILQGEVGSGKTAVAGAIMHTVVNTTPPNQKAGRLQVAYLAPTEILAEQQYNFFKEFFSHIEINIGLITSKKGRKFPSKIDKTKDTEISKNQLKSWVESGEVSILVGTHALIQKDIKFKNLGLVIIDEQHRFGVEQRNTLLRQDKVTPHMLSMSATPIPRTLALTVYGDLDISIIDELPKNRKQVKTTLLTESQKEKAYKKIDQEIKKGRQAYIVCPRVEDGDDTLNLHSVDEEEKIIKEKFRNYKIAKLHGKLKQDKKTEIIKDFRDKKIDILITTTVVEVGIDIPNATLMIIENAERFGLSQLHQLRGRITRGEHESHCFLISDTKAEITLERLKLLTETTDGFKLAEKDLDLRGAGELFGLSQSGISDFGMQALKNPKLVEITQKEARDLVEADPELIEHIDIELEIQRRHFSRGNS